MSLYLLIPAALTYLVLAGLFRELNIYRQTHNQENRPTYYDHTDANLASVFWPVYLFFLVVLSCFQLVPTIVVAVKDARKKHGSKVEGILSSADYRKYKRWVEDYERNLHVGER